MKILNKFIELKSSFQVKQYQKKVMNVKRKQCLMNKKGVVYKMLCGTCDFCYVGEMCRSLAARVKEHEYAIRSFYINNAIAKHSIVDTGLLPDLKNIKILGNKEHDFKNILEAIKKVKKESSIWTADTASALYGKVS